MAGLLGRKIGMTNIFDGEGRFVPVTLVEAGPCFVLGVKTSEKDGYRSVVLGFEDKKQAKTKKPEQNYFKALKITPKKVIKEFRTGEDPKHKTGDVLGAAMFNKGEFVDVRGRTIGKGFQGGVKRWKWSGGEAGHGSMFHRAPGSIGASSFPSRVFKGQHLPGHMGAVMRTSKNMEIIDIDADKNILVLKGSTPGHNGTLLEIRHAKKPAKKPKKAAEEKAEDKKGAVKKGKK